MEPRRILDAWLACLELANYGAVELDHEEPVGLVLSPALDNHDRLIGGTP
jgi:hypothetical protein